MGTTEIQTVPRDGQADLATHARLIESARLYSDAARATLTTKAYQGDWKRFTDWCASMGLLPLPASPSTVALYLTHRAEQGRKPSVLERELAAISVAHRLAGEYNPRQDPMVKELLKGVRRTKGTAQRRVTPLLPVDLRAMSVALPPDKLSGLRDRAIFLFGFAGAFRRSEICAFRMEDVAFVTDGIEVILRRSKTDQEGRGEKKGIPYGSDPATCPVRALKRWIEASHIIRGPLFRSINRHGDISLTPITGRSIARLIKGGAEAAGIASENVSGHSLRAGLATQAARSGKSIHAIMRQTGHKSVNMVQKYVREATLFQDNAAAGIGL